MCVKSLGIQCYCYYSPCDILNISVYAHNIVPYDTKFEGR